MKITTILFLFFLFLNPIAAQITISGVVVDDATNYPLAFANVMTENGGGGISNEKGRFVIVTDEMPKKLIVSYVGYELKEIKLIEGEYFYPIKLKSASLELNEIEVLASDKNAADILFSAIENSRKLSASRLNSKVFRRTYSTINDGTPSELLEAYYNSIVSDGGVFSFELKNGRIGIPVDNHILQLDLCKILENYNFYGNNIGYFPPSPLQEKSVKKILKEYYVRYSGSFLSVQDTILEIAFESKTEGKAFNGIAFINKNKNSIVRVVHQVNDADHVPFQTVLDKKGTSVEKMGLRWDTGFEYGGDLLLIKYMHLILDLDYLSNGERVPFKANTKLFFYDYNHLFEVPIFGENIVLNDYDKIMATPYNPDFWQRITILPETGMEERFRKDLEANRYFVNADPMSGDIGLLNQKFQLIDLNKRPNWGRIANAKKSTYDRQIQSNLGTDSYNCLYAKTFLALDYNCFADTTQFTVKAVLDYDNSYMCYRNNEEALFFIKFLQIADLYARELENDLHVKYKHNCPGNTELMEELKAAEKAMRKEIFARLNGRNNRTKEYLEELDAILAMRKKQM